MISEKIGINAGKLWSALEETGSLPLKKAKTRVKLTNPDLFMAMGWLKREDKISISDDADMVMTLK